MRRLPLALVLLTALVVVACGGDDHHDDTSTAAAVGGESSAAGAPSAADVTFAQGMIPHHEQAVEMAEIALDPAVGAGAEVTDLAARIRDAQDPEIETMRGWLAAWGEQELTDMSDDHSAHGMEGMMSADEMAALEQKTGSAFDRAWMEMMIRHHQGAITMAETVRSDGSVDEVKALAATIIAAQQQEIDEMQALLDA